MTLYMTEQEQFEAIKSWFKRYFKIIFTIVFALLAAFSIHKYMVWHQDKMMQQASASYEQLMLSLSNNDSKAVKAYLKDLTNNHAATVYATVAKLILAKLAVNHGDYNKAIRVLDEVIEQHGMRFKQSALRQVAIIRKARLLIAQKKYKYALSSLKKISDKAYIPVINELKGDIYAASGENKRALAFYGKALNQTAQKGVSNPFLDMKTAQLAAIFDRKSNSHTYA